MQSSRFPVTSLRGRNDELRTLVKELEAKLAGKAPAHERDGLAQRTKQQATRTARVVAMPPGRVEFEVSSLKGSGYGEAGGHAKHGRRGRSSYIRGCDV
eukprot:3456613-Pleurochrysis_carterae.AAC.2